MISEVDEALKEIVRSDALGGADVEVQFDAPTKDWAARRNSPTVNLYLYDIREDLRRRERGFRENRNEDGVVVSRSPVPRYFKLSYLLTAWTQRPEDEHRLLDGCLRAFLGMDALPDHLVTGALAEPRLTVPISVGLPPPEDRAFADVWSALGGELKPSLDLVVTAPVELGVSYPAGPPVEEGVVVEVADTVDGGSERRQKHVPPPATEEPAGSLADAGPTRTPRARKRKA